MEVSEDCPNLVPPMNWTLPRPRVLRLTTSLALLTAFALRAQPLPDADAMGLFAGELLDRQHLDTHGPGIAVLVARGDEILVKTARGLASLELGVPLSTEHRFRIGSVTKQIAAATLLRLVDEGRARLEDPLAQYVPDFPNGRAITLAMLLNHTSGVKSYTDIEGYMGNPVRRDLDTPELIRVFKDLKVDFPPGSAWAYNNSAYVLVGAVIEKITGKPWWQTPVTFPTPLFYPDPKHLVPGHVCGYTREAQNPWAPSGLISMTQPQAAGALVGDLLSLWRWNQSLHEQAFLKPETYRRMTTPEGPAVASKYGFGLFIHTLRGERIFSHSGGIHGFHSELQYLPAKRITVVLLRNADSGPNLGSIGRQLGAFAAGNPFPRPAPVSREIAQLKAFEGIYSRGKDLTTLRIVHNALTSQRSAESPVVLTPVGASRFLFDDTSVQIDFARNLAGVVTGFEQFPDGDGEGVLWNRSADLPGTPP